jgi:tRNA-modifying protein YgfZ
VLVDVAADLADDVQRRLTLYKLRSKVTLERVDLPVTRGLGPAPEGALADPRDPALGWRLYGAALEKGEAPDWDALRIAARVPETGRRVAAERELHPGDGFRAPERRRFPQGLLRRAGGYRPDAPQDHAAQGAGARPPRGPAEPGAELLTEDGKPAGTLHTVAGDRGLAWLRFDRAAGGLTAGAARVTAELDSLRRRLDPASAGCRSLRSHGPAPVAKGLHGDPGERVTAGAGKG